MPGDPEEIVDAPTSIRAGLEAGFAAAEAASAPAPAAAPAVMPDTAQIPAPAAAAAPDATAAEAPKPGEQPRAADGKFAPKDPNAPPTAAAAPEAKPAAEAKITDQPAAATPGASQEPTRAPASWSAVAKSKWSTVDPVVQAEVSKREADMDKGLQERAQQLKRYEPLEQVIGPHRDRIHLAGIDEAAYVRSLIAADEMLRGPNRLQAMAQIAQGYGIDLRQLGQPGQQQPAQAAQQPHPQLQAVQSEIAELKGQLAQFTSAAQQADTAQTQAQITAFAESHPYFENVRPLMAALVSSGQAKGLEDAYDMACRASPDVYAVISQEKLDAQAAALRAEAQARATEARQASGSIAGSPTPGAAPARTGPPPSIRESLEQQFSAAL